MLIYDMRRSTRHHLSSKKKKTLQVTSNKYKDINKVSVDPLYLRFVNVKIPLITFKTTGGPDKTRIAFRLR